MLALQSSVHAFAEPSHEGDQVRRETFEMYFEVKPWSSEGTEAQLYIRDYLKLDQATPREHQGARPAFALRLSESRRPDVQDKPGN